MSQNTSHAVMAQRHEADDSLDDFPTMPWATRALMDHRRMDRKASSATSYSWLVWIHNMASQPLHWIPPCRARLERDSDYPEAA